MLTPGTYLRKRREAAGVSLEDLAARLVGLPFPVQSPARADIDRLVALLTEAEADRNNLTIAKAAYLLNVYRFDISVYELLLLIHYAGDGHGYPAPQICRECGCTWHDACQTKHGPCAWSLHDAGLCTACIPAPAPVTKPEGVPA